MARPWTVTAGTDLESWKERENTGYVYPAAGRNSELDLQFYQPELGIGKLKCRAKLLLIAVIPQRCDSRARLRLASHRECTNTASGRVETVRVPAQLYQYVETPLRALHMCEIVPALVDSEGHVYRESAPALNVGLRHRLIDLPRVLLVLLLLLLQVQYCGYELQWVMTPAHHCRASWVHVYPVLIIIPGTRILRIRLSAQAVMMLARDLICPTCRATSRNSCIAKSNTVLVPCLLCDKLYCPNPGTRATPRPFEYQHRRVLQRRRPGDFYPAVQN
eukprot:3804861-Rhodomonas_salina.2